MLQFKGQVVKVLDKVQVSEKFTKRELILTDGAASYPQMISFQFTQDKCNLLNNIHPGDEVEVTFGLKGREWKGKYFNSLDGYRIAKVTGENTRFVPTPDQDLPF